MNLSSVNNVLRMLRRQAFWIIAGTFLGLVAGSALLLWLPKMYRARTMIMVEAQKVPKEYVKSTITHDINARLRTIRQQITNRATMLRVAQEVHLYPQLHQEPQRLVIRVARGLGVRVIGSSIFTITYKYRDPQLASDAANRIAALFIEENLKLRESQVENTSAFLESELRSTKSKLEAQEAKVAEFRFKNEGELPEQRVTNLSTIARYETQLRIVEDDISEAELKRTFLSGVAERKPEVREASSEKAEQLSQARRELLNLRAQYTSRHPDIIQLESEIALLEGTLDSGELSEVVVEELTQSPLVRSLDAELQKLKTERNRILSQIAVRQRRLERIPRVGQELLKLTRDYDNVRQSYESLLNKLLDARLSENLEKSQQSERFLVLEEARPPSEAYFPKRGLVLATGGVLGLLLGFGLGILREQTSQTLDNAEALKEAFPGVRVLSSIPQFDSAREPRVFWAKVKKRAAG